jgi:MFS family permease
LSDTLVSLVFLTQPVGYFIAAYVNSSIHIKFGQRGIAVIGPSCQLIFAIGASFHPTYPVFLALSVLGGVGTGLHDASWNAWTGGMAKNANTIQGFMHGSFSSGAALGPFISGSMLSVAKLPWYTWFYVVVR